ncbi:hypothetical protein BJ875DRAFT_471683 [Amylocarpus encephaloides]|uniref:Uncharacterized protein n=1 Tax=Amylocarpus encephaloides TaxID=45428 RepID=A0A9P8C1N5_9HELO|nr:hypothetical protein BJ875DRAFT_471683 [Amylocarpus encephaloides]
MYSTSPPNFLPSSDPALLEDWEGNAASLLSNIPDSDDFEALNLVKEEAIALKNKAGVVIQYRAWPVEDSFRRRYINE